MNDQQMIQRMRKELLFLRWFMLVITLAILAMWFTGFTQPASKQHFGEIDVERLNIVDNTGKLCYVLTNGTRAPGAIIGGVERKRANSNNTPAIIFYNGEGDECGALYTAGKVKNDSEYFGSSRLVFDRFRHDETLAFQYYEDELGGYAGMLVQDTQDMPTLDWIDGNAAIKAMPEGPGKQEALEKFRASAGPWATKRVFVGKYDKSKESVVDLMDRKGNRRLQLSVDSLGNPRMLFFNESGDVICKLPDAAVSGTKNK